MPDVLEGELIAGCRLDEVAGRGGMGVVYRATQLSLNRPVAVKLIAPERTGDPGFRERFERESRLAASIDHPNVIPVHAAGEERGRLYLVMRWVDGIDVQALLAESGSLPALAAGIAAQVADALDAAHAAGLVHRDVKPANVLLSGRHAYLADFGLTRPVGDPGALTTTGQWLGTAAYMAPEQFDRDDAVDARADVYALGCVLYAMLCGEPPFRRASVPATMLAHQRERVPSVAGRPGVPAAFDAVLDRALAKDPARRYESAGDLGRAALAAAEGRPAPAATGSVAVGEAAPSEEPTRVLAGEAPTLLASAPAPDEPEPTRWLGGDDPPPRRLRDVRRRTRVAAIGAVALLAAAVAAIVLAPGGGDPDQPGRPVSESQVRDAAAAFAQAYAKEDVPALRRLLMPDVERVTAGGRVAGRSDVLESYAAQFARDDTEGFDLSSVSATGGVAGRAEADYRMTRGNGAPVSGHLVLGVLRDHGRPRIALITSAAG